VRHVELDILGMLALQLRSKKVFAKALKDFKKRIEGLASLNDY